MQSCSIPYASHSTSAYQLAYCLVVVRQRFLDEKEYDLHWLAVNNQQL